MSFSCCPQLLSNEPVLIPGYYCLGWQFMQICRCWPTGLVLKLTLIQLLFRYQCLKQKWARREMTAVFFSLCFVWNCGQIFFFQVPIPDREKWWTSLSSIFFTTKTSGMCQKMNLPFVWNLVHKSFAFFSQKKKSALPSIPHFVSFVSSFAAPRVPCKLSAASLWGIILLEWDATVCTYCSIELVFVGSVFCCCCQSNFVQLEGFVGCIDEHH